MQFSRKNIEPFFCWPFWFFFQSIFPMKSTLGFIWSIIFWKSWWRRCFQPKTTFLYHFAQDCNLSNFICQIITILCLWALKHVAIAVLKASRRFAWWVAQKIFFQAWRAYSIFKCMKLKSYDKRKYMIIPNIFLNTLKMNKC